MISHSIASLSYAAFQARHHEHVPTHAPTHELIENLRENGGNEQENLSLSEHLSLLPQNEHLYDLFDLYGAAENKTNEWLSSSDKLHSTDPQPICSLTDSDQCSIFVLAETQGESLYPDGYRLYASASEPANLPDLNQDPSYSDNSEIGLNNGPDQLGLLSPYASQPLTVAVVPFDAAHKEPEKASSYHGFTCENNCGGNFIGLHKCFRHQNSLIISCSGSHDCSSTFRTRHEFTRHYNARHLHDIVGSKRLLDCPVAGCLRVGEKGFTRRDNLLQHRRAFHGEDIPKVRMRFGYKGSQCQKQKVRKISVGKGGGGRR